MKSAHGVSSMLRMSWRSFLISSISFQCSHLGLVFHLLVLWNFSPLFPPFLSISSSSSPPSHAGVGFQPSYLLGKHSPTEHFYIVRNLDQLHKFSAVSNRQIQQTPLRETKMSSFWRISTLVSIPFFFSTFQFLCLFMSYIKCVFLISLNIDMFVLFYNAHNNLNIIICF